MIGEEDYGFFNNFENINNFEVISSPNIDDITHFYEVKTVLSDAFHKKRDLKQLEKDLESDKDLEEDSSDRCQEDNGKYEHKRKLNRIRAQRNRERKKNYYKQLESRNEFLERENIRLHNEKRKLKFEQEQAFIGSNGSQNSINYNSNTDEDSCGEIRVKERNSCDKSYAKRLDSIKGLFTSIIENLLTRKELWMLSQIEDQDIRRKKKFKRCNNLHKYHREDFMKENKLNEVDEVLSSIGASNRQSKIFNKFFSDELFKTKELLSSGVQMMMKAQKLFNEGLLTMQSLIDFNKDCNIFSQEDLKKALDCINNNNYEASVTAEQVFGVSAQQKMYQFKYKRQKLDYKEKIVGAKSKLKYLYECNEFAQE